MDDCYEGWVDSMSENQVWEVVDLLCNCIPIGKRWVLKVDVWQMNLLINIKHVLWLKVMPSERIDYEETLSLVVRFTSVRLLLLVAHLDWELFQMEVKTSFLNGELDEEIYMKLLIGFEFKRKHKLCHLKHSIYSLKQSSS